MTSMLLLRCSRQLKLINHAMDPKGTAGGTGLELYSSFSHDIDGTVIVWREAEPN